MYRLLGDTPANIVNSIILMRMINGVEWIKWVWGRRPSRVGLPRKIPRAQNVWIARIISNLLLNSQVKPERSACSVIIYIQLNAVRLFETMIIVITLIYIPCSMLKNKFIFRLSYFQAAIYFYYSAKLSTDFHPPPFSVRTILSNEVIKIGILYHLTYFNKFSANSFRIVYSCTFKPDFENVETRKQRTTLM